MSTPEGRGLCLGGECLSRGSLTRGGLCPGGLCPGVSVQGVSVHGGLCLGVSVRRVSVTETRCRTAICMQYASYWNAFLVLYKNCKKWKLYCMGTVSFHGALWIRQWDVMFLGLLTRFLDQHLCLSSLQLLDVHLGLVVLLEIKPLIILPFLSTSSRSEHMWWVLRKHR